MRRLASSSGEVCLRLFPSPLASSNKIRVLEIIVVCFIFFFSFFSYFLFIFFFEWGNSSPYSTFSASRIDGILQKLRSKSSHVRTNATSGCGVASKSDFTPRLKATWMTKTQSADRALRGGSGGTATH